MIAPEGLGAVLAVVEDVLGPGCASLFHAWRGGAEMLRIRSDVADFESLPLPGGIEHLLNGAVAGSVEQVTAFVRGLSDALREAKVEHTFQVHDGREIVLSLPQ